MAEDLVSELEAGKFQAREQYLAGLERYASRLPGRPEEGNILLADAEARTLRNLFAAEADIIAAPFASKLKTFLEQHIGLRVFYPEIMNFYRDVQIGRIDVPLPLDAVEGLIQAVSESTPTVFEPSITEALQESSESGLETLALPVVEFPAAEPNQPFPPKDPLGEVDPQKARDLTFAGTTNSLWKAFLEGEKVHKALQGWVRASDALRPHVNDILNWLHSFLNSGGGSPPMPPMG